MFILSSLKGSFWCLQQRTSISGGHQFHSVHQKLYPLPQISNDKVEYLHTNTLETMFLSFRRASEKTLLFLSLAGEISKTLQTSVTCINTSVSVVIMRRKSPTVQTSVWATSQIKPGRISVSSARL